MGQRVQGEGHCHIEYIYRYIQDKEIITCIWMTVKHLVHERIGRGKELEVGNRIKTRSLDPHSIDRYTRNQIP